MHKKYYLVIGTLLMMFHLSAMTDQTAASTVTSTCDGGPGSLREAIAAAVPGETIDFAANVKGTILLTSTEIEINKAIGSNLTIKGPGANILSIESNLAFRVFRVQLGNIKISGLRISRGFAPNAFPNQGGGIWVVEGANLTLENCWIIGNQRGGIFTQSDSSLTISNSMIAGNEGGGVVGAGSLNVSNSSVSENSGVGGAGISWLNGVVTMSNVTVSGNNGIDGGGITINGATTAIVNCTIAFNRGATGGLRIESGTVNLKNTIIANNDGFTPDVGGTVVSYGHNLVSDTEGSVITPAPGASGDQLDADAQLGAYANNGGMTYTVSLRTGSPAINGGDNCVLIAGCDPILPPVALATDQRGVARPQGASVDIGAYESGVRPPAFGKIVFVSNRDGNEEIYSMNADGTNQNRLTTNSAFDTEPDWSPDGSKIAFTTTRAGNKEIYTMSDTGTGLVNLTTSSAFEFEPAWSPDGTRIAYTRTTSDVNNDYEIWVMDSNGANQTQLTNANPGQGRAPSWSPDGSQIVFTSFPGNGDTNSIDVMDADGTNRRTLLFSDADGVNVPAWSPDGNRIAYNNDVLGQTIYVANPFDTVDLPLRPLNNNHRANSPAWSPDGTKLAYHDPRSVGGIFIVDGDGTNPIRLVASSSTVSNESPDWFGFNTAIGSNVAVDLGTVDLSFSSINAAGTTTATPIDPASVGTLPGGYWLGAGYPAYEIHTTATYTAPITVCLQVPSVTDPSVFSALRILHNDAGTIRDETILPPDTPEPNFGTKTICARVNSLSPFVVAQSTATPEPTPTIVAAGATLVNESCSTNSQIDPGERVTVNLKLTNSGGASTTNLIATLQSSAGVVAPTGPKVYGIVAPGEMKGLDFSFTAGPTLTSGQPISLTLQLQDGLTGNPAPISFEFIAGSSPCGGVRLVVTSSTLNRSGGIVTTLLTVQNTGTLPADGVVVTAAMLGSTTGVIAPSNLGTIGIGASSSAQVSFTTAATGSSQLKFSGTYGPGVGGNGTFSSTKRVTVP